MVPVKADKLLLLPITEAKAYNLLVLKKNFFFFFFFFSPVLIKYAHNKMDATIHDVKEKKEEK